MDGAQGRSRTTDTAIFSRMLYQLSYLGAGARSGWLAQRRTDINPDRHCVAHSLADHRRVPAAGPERRSRR